MSPIGPVRFRGVWQEHAAKAGCYAREFESLISALYQGSAKHCVADGRPFLVCGLGRITPSRGSMANNPFIQRVSANGKDIQAIIFDRLAPAVEGESLSNSVLAMLTFSVLLMRPNVDVELLQDVVMSTSEHMIMALMDVVPGEAN